uniref:6-pyruvoyl tetrahydrobiopterin synthase (PTPS) (PTP synthase) n=1 Tax=mine drainage metagenome TaxID=410659 RepID=E6QMF4_9ZZZZ
MNARFSRRYAFSASHRLHTERLTPEQNSAAFGKCNNPHGHGHNYVVQVTVAGPIDPATGMVINMATLDEVVQGTILDRFDHQNLNLDPLFGERVSNLVSTTENLCIEVYRLLKAALEPARLASIRIEETENNFFEYSEQDSMNSPLTRPKTT